MSNLRLKPCPFCGGKAKFIFIPTKREHIELVMVECTKCHNSSNCFEVNVAEKEERKQKAVAEQWNKRPDDWIEPSRPSSWISAKDGLPEKENSGWSVDVLVLSGGKISVGYYHYIDNCWRSVDGVLYEPSVSYWMPIPEPPR